MAPLDNSHALHVLLDPDCLRARDSALGAQLGVNGQRGVESTSFAAAAAAPESSAASMASGVSSAPLCGHPAGSWNESHLHRRLTGTRRNPARAPQPALLPASVLPGAHEWSCAHACSFQARALLCPGWGSGPGLGQGQAVDKKNIGAGLIAGDSAPVVHNVGAGAARGGAGRRGDHACSQPHSQVLAQRLRRHVQLGGQLGRLPLWLVLRSARWASQAAAALAWRRGLPCRRAVLQGVVRGQRQPWMAALQYCLHRGACEMCPLTSYRSVSPT